MPPFVPSPFIKPVLYASPGKSSLKSPARYASTISPSNRQVCQISTSTRRKYFCTSTFLDYGWRYTYRNRFITLCFIAIFGNLLTGLKKIIREAKTGHQCMNPQLQAKMISRSFTFFLHELKKVKILQTSATNPYSGCCLCAFSSWL